MEYLNWIGLVCTSFHDIYASVSPFQFKFIHLKVFKTIDQCLIMTRKQNIDDLYPKYLIITESCVIPF